MNQKQRIVMLHDMHLIVYRQGNRRRYLKPLSPTEEDSPEALRRMQEREVLRQAYTEMAKRGAGPRYTGDEAQRPVYDGKAPGNGDEADGPSEFGKWYCPVCGCEVGELYIPQNNVQGESWYCPDCGTRIEWHAIHENYKTGGYATTVNYEDVLEVIEKMDKEGDEESVSAAAYLRSELEFQPKIMVDGKKGMKPAQVERETYYHVDENNEIVMKKSKVMEWVCPICNWFVGSHRSTVVGEKKKPTHFCGLCGQKIDWSNIELGEEYDDEGLRD